VQLHPFSYFDETFGCKGGEVCLEDKEGEVIKDPMIGSGGEKGGVWGKGERQKGFQQKPFIINGVRAGLQDKMKDKA